MIKFEYENIDVQIVRLKSVTTALGGSISVVDDSRSTPTKEVYKRIVVPMAVARAFIQKYAKVTKYLKPVYTAVVYYGTHVIAMERHPLGMMGELTTIGPDDEEITWNPYCESNMNKLVYPMMFNSGRDWFFDGRYAFSFDYKDLDEVVDRGVHMTKDSHFRKITCLAFDLQELPVSDKLQPQERSCVAFVTSDFEYVISPPIWKDIESMRASNRDDEEDAKAMVSFDRMNETMSVNLNFALKAGKEIGSMFGYEYVEPLHLPSLMIRLHTVNLPNIPKQVKSTYDIGMSFNNAMAWTLGMLRRSNTLDTYIMVRSLIKYLSKRGIYKNNAFHADQIFVDGQTVEDVPMLDMDELLEDADFTAYSMDQLISETVARKKGRTTPRDINVIGGLLTEQ